MIHLFLFFFFFSFYYITLWYLQKATSALRESGTNMNKYNVIYKEQKNKKLKEKVEQIPRLKEIEFSCAFFSLCFYEIIDR